LKLVETELKGVDIIEPAVHGDSRGFFMESYSREHDRGFLWNDPDLNIDWPTTNPILSEKDKNQPFFKDMQHELQLNDMEVRAC
jgi:dTDP-4-dehydrorhamnose 3,5-epimerase-like enzyme